VKYKNTSVRFDDLFWTLYDVIVTTTTLVLRWRRRNASYAQWRVNVVIIVYTTTIYNISLAFRWQTVCTLFISDSVLDLVFSCASVLIDLNKSVTCVLEGLYMNGETLDCLLDKLTAVIWPCLKRCYSLQPNTHFRPSPLYYWLQDFIVWNCKGWVKKIIAKLTCKKGKVLWKQNLHMECSSLGFIETVHQYKWMMPPHWRLTTLCFDFCNVYMTNFLKIICYVSILYHWSYRQLLLTIITS